MDSDSDQDEEEKHHSLSVTINEGRSICNIGRRVGSECSIVAVECVSASESITQCSVENVDNFTVTEIMSDDDLTDSVTFAEDEETKEPPFKIIRVSCKRQVLRELMSNIADDRVFTAEKNMDDEPDPDKSAQDDEKVSSDRENRSETSPDSTTATNAADPTNPSNSSEQSPAENEPESGLVDTMETPSSPVHTALVTPDSMEATHSPHAASSVSPGPAEAPSPAPVSVATPDSKGTPSTSVPTSLTIPNKRESQEEKLVDPVEGKLESSSDHAVQSCTSNNNLPHGSTHFASELSQCTSLLDIEMILVENLLNTCLAAIENVLPEEYQESCVLASENPLTEETVGTLGAEDLNPNLPGTSDTPVPIAGLENVQSSSAGQLAGKKRKHSAKKTADTEGAVGGSSAENSVSSGDAEESFENKDSDKEAKKKKNRCAVCRKKVGLTGFECRCGGLFCAVHRYSDKHDCTFDYREMGAQEIRRNNPVVVGEKIQKI